MLATHVDQESNLVEIDAAGPIDADAMEQCQALCRRVIDEHGSIRLLARYGEVDLRNTEPKAFWEDLRNTALVPHVDRCAILGDSDSLRAVSDVVGRVLPCEVKTFALGQERDARAWLSRDQDA